MTTIEQVAARIASGLPHEAFPDLDLPATSAEIIRSMLRRRQGRSPNRVRMEARLSLYPVIGYFAWNRVLGEVRIVIDQRASRRDGEDALMADCLADSLMRAAATAPLAWIWALQKEVGR